ncbi:PepSY-associated TM helix domain-containing protein [Algoriphagus sp.]|uniref:PepSY-associated TM helix domain-containing protein n=1 Tax=Algoriphagus sp. TaxID=1872435 RepID=UPI003280047F
MKFKKKVFFDIHSWIGIKLSILFFIVCFSGTIATLSHEMDWLFIPEMRAEEQNVRASKNQIILNLRAAYPNGTFTYWAASEEPYLCDIIYVVQDEKQVYAFANPYTGVIQGHASITFQRFFRDLHYYLFIPFQVGHFTVLIFSFLLLISLTTALLFYKKWYSKLFELKIHNGPLVFFRSLHRLVGLWSIPFTLLFSITGIWYFAERTNIGNLSDIANPKAPKIESRFSEEPNASDFVFTVDYSLAEQKAQKAIPGLIIKDILPPKNPTEPIYLTGLSDVPLVRNRANRVYLDPKDYKVIGVQNAAELNTATYLNDIADPIHFGNWGGLITKVIWFVMGMGISSLILTGIWISLKRKVKSRAKQMKQRMGVWKYLNWAMFLVVIGFMYAALISNYHATPAAFITITAGWFVFITLAWYLFEVKLREIAATELKQERTKVI